MKKIKIIYMDCHCKTGLIPPSKYDTTMTAGQLIEYLKKEDPDTPIYISDDGWSYKCIDDSVFSQAYIDIIDEEVKYMKEIYRLRHKGDV